MTITTSIPRPKSYDQSVREAAALEVLPEFEAWSGEELTDEARSEVLTTLADGMRWHSNGYDFAKEFEAMGWDVNAELVELLDNASTWRAHRNAVRAWIAETGARPQLAIGATVVIPAPQSNAGTAGEIVGINEDEGTYTVFCESLGHVRDGLGTHGRIFEWEAVEPAAG